MTLADRERWNRKYLAGNPNPAFAPDPVLTTHADLLEGAGMALDLACGVGHNILFLARRGYEVVAMDGSLVGLRYAHQALAAASLRAHLVAIDLDRLALPPRYFSLVLVARFFSRPLIPQLKETLVPGGLVIYSTFNHNRHATHPGFCEDYLLQAGELSRLFADFELIVTNEAPELKEEISYWIGRRSSR